MTRLDANAAPEPMILPSLDEPEQWFTCPTLGCGKEYPYEVVGQCWACDKAAERAKARELGIKRAGLVGWHAELEADHPKVMALFGAKSADALRGRVTKLLHTPTNCAAITITGAAGAGKSTLAVLLAKARLSGALFTRALSLAAADAQHALGRGEADLLARARAASLLVIDELKVPAIAARRDVLEELLWSRVDAGDLTIVTHGFGEEEIMRDWGAGTHRRLYVEAQHIHLLCPACKHDVHRGACSTKDCACARRMEVTS